MYNQTPEEWAQLVFGNADLGDPRRTRRLTQLANDMASNAGSSIVKASETPCEELGDVSCANTLKKPSKIKTRTLYAHSTLAIDAGNENVIGLLDQYYWFRKTKVKGTREQQQHRPFVEKESYRWQQTLIDIKARTGDLSNVLNICDREADIYEYMDYQKTEGHRFLVRAKEKRKLIEPS